MIEPQTNSDLLFRQKFENFAVPPPEGSWAGIQAGIVAGSAPFYIQYWKPIAAVTAVLVIIVTGVLLLTPGENHVPEKNEISIPMISDSGNQQNLPSDDSKIKESQSISEIGKKIENNELVPKTDQEVVLVENKEQTITNTNSSIDNVDKSEVVKSNQYNYNNTGYQENLAITEESSINTNPFTKVESESNTEGNSDLILIQALYSTDVSDLSIQNNDDPQMIRPAESELAYIDPELGSKKGGWSTGFYFTPEIMLNNFDSVEMLANYSFGIEPTYYINKHLFVRFGLGATYSRDQGFAKLDYLNNELLGTYDHVYDVTFDSIDGVVVPTYHTKTVEVWDTVRHLEINSLTNKYFYLQIPVLFGYYNSTTKFKWYFYGGPAINYMISKQIDQPTNGVEYSEMLEVKNELPERSPYYFQLWLGAGIEYKVSNRLGVAIEPNYRYYFNNVFKESPYSNTALSGVSLRVGLVYTIH